MGFFDNDEMRPRQGPAHELGTDLSLLSIAELDDRIALLKDEIVRLEEAKAAKQSSRGAADKFFR